MVTKLRRGIINYYKDDEIREKIFYIKGVPKKEVPNNKCLCLKGKCE